MSLISGPLSDARRTAALLALEYHGQALAVAAEPGVFVAGSERLLAETLAALRRVGYCELRYRRGRPYRYVLTERGRERAMGLRLRP